MLVRNIEILNKLRSYQIKPTCCQADWQHCRLTGALSTLVGIMATPPHRSEGTAVLSSSTRSDKSNCYTTSSVKPWYLIIHRENYILLDMDRLVDLGLKQDG